MIDYLEPCHLVIEYISRISTFLAQIVYFVVTIGVFLVEETSNFVTGITNRQLEIHLKRNDKFHGLHLNVLQTKGHCVRYQNGLFGEKHLLLTAFTSMNGGHIRSILQ